MSQDLLLCNKWTFRAHGHTVVLVKKRYEHAAHVLMKALLWALYLPQYPDLRIEVPVGARYTPDVVQIDDQARPVFWGEAGRVGTRKINRLVDHYRGTHFAFAKWARGMAPLEATVRKALEHTRRTAPVDLIAFPADSSERFIASGGNISIQPDDVPSIRL